MATELIDILIIQVKDKYNKLQDIIDYAEDEFTKLERLNISLKANYNAMSINAISKEIHQMSCHLIKINEYIEKAAELENEIIDISIKIIANDDNTISTYKTSFIKYIDNGELNDCVSDVRHLCNLSTAASNMIKSCIELIAYR